MGKITQVYQKMYTVKDSVKNRNYKDNSDTKGLKYDQLQQEYKKMVKEAYQNTMKEQHLKLIELEKKINEKKARLEKELEEMRNPNREDTEIDIIQKNIKKM